MHEARNFSHGNILSDAIETTHNSQLTTHNSQLTTHNISPKIGALIKFFPY